MNKSRVRCVTSGISFRTFSSSPSNRFSVSGSTGSSRSKCASTCSCASVPRLSEACPPELLPSIGKASAKLCATAFPPATAPNPRNSFASHAMSFPSASSASRRTAPGVPRTASSARRNNRRFTSPSLSRSKPGYPRTSAPPMCSTTIHSGTSPNVHPFKSYRSNLGTSFSHASDFTSVCFTALWIAPKSRAATTVRCF